MTRTARCCCGTCTVEVAGEPALNAICHCDNCKRRTGSAFGWSAYFAAGQVLRRTGEVKCYAVTGANPQERWFCARCGTTLFWTAPAFKPGHVGIAGGCFVESPLPAPSATVANDRRCAWLALPAAWGGSL